MALCTLGAGCCIAFLRSYSKPLLRYIREQSALSGSICGLATAGRYQSVNSSKLREIKGPSHAGRPSKCRSMRGLRVALEADTALGRAALDLRHVDDQSAADFTRLVLLFHVLNVV